MQATEAKSKPYLMVFCFKGSYNVIMIDERMNDNIYTETQIVAITNEVAKVARKELGDRLSDVILYGSYARGDYKEWSDIDMMIVAQADDIEVNQIKNLLAEKLWSLIFETNLLLSIIVVSVKKFEQYKGILPFYINVEREGRRIIV
ncbi:MAG: nucleotidyltransferase domain-containing protein [Clostridiales Family XIII bacterium]|nr:nucleotidyltransferase domain-containing protein [Clostridiales Family XIII bacterium]